MIGYIYLKSNNKIINVVKDIISINGNDIVGKDINISGIDFNIVDIFCCENDLNLEVGAVLVIDELVNNKNNFILESVRAKRNQLLAECDWTQLSDSPLTNEQKILWANYRQELRDLPTTVDINNIIYPTKP